MCCSSESPKGVRSVLIREYSICTISVSEPLHSREEAHQFFRGSGPMVRSSHVRVDIVTRVRSGHSLATGCVCPHRKGCGFESRLLQCCSHFCFIVADLFFACSASMNSICSDLPRDYGICRISFLGLIHRLVLPRRTLSGEVVQWQDPRKVKWTLSRG